MNRLLPAIALALVLARSRSPRVDLNTATKDDLVALSGIGPAKAQAILDYRAAARRFQVRRRAEVGEGHRRQAASRSCAPNSAVASVPAKAAPRQDAKAAGQGGPEGAEVSACDGAAGLPVPEGPSSAPSRVVRRASTAADGPVAPPADSRSPRCRRAGRDVRGHCLQAPAGASAALRMMGQRPATRGAF